MQYCRNIFAVGIVCLWFAFVFTPLSFAAALDFSGSEADSVATVVDVEAAAEAGAKGFQNDPEEEETAAAAAAAAKEGLQGLSKVATEGLEEDVIMHLTEERDDIPTEDELENEENAKKNVRIPLVVEDGQVVGELQSLQLDGSRRQLRGLKTMLLSFLMLLFLMAHRGENGATYEERIALLVVILSFIRLVQSVFSNTTQYSLSLTVKTNKKDGSKKAVIDSLPKDSDSYLHSLKLLGRNLLAALIICGLIMTVGLPFALGMMLAVVSVVLGGIAVAAFGAGGLLVDLLKNAS